MSNFQKQSVYQELFYMYLLIGIFFNLFLYNLINVYICSRLGDAYRTFCSLHKRESGVNPEQCPLL